MASDDKMGMMAQMFEQMQKQQAMMTAALMPNAGNIDLNAIMGSSSFMPPGQIVQTLRTPDSCCSRENNNHPNNYNNYQQPQDDAMMDNSLICSCDFDDNEIAGHRHVDDYSSWYCQDSEMQQNLDCPPPPPLYQANNDCGCDAGAAAVGVDVHVMDSCDTCDPAPPQIVACSVDDDVCAECEDTDEDTDWDSSDDDSSDCYVEEGCGCGGEKATIITLKDDTGEKKETVTAGVQTAPTTESRAVQAIEMKNVSCLTDPPPKEEAPIEEVFDRIFRFGDQVAKDNMSKKKPELPTPTPEIPKTPPHDPVLIKFDLAIRLDEVRDLPHLLAAPHSNIEHYCAYCTPETEGLVRPPMLLKVRLSVYDRATGRLTHCDDGVVNSETNWALTNVRHNRYIFGRQSAVFRRAVVSQDAILVVRIYAREKRQLLHIDPAYTLIVRQPLVDATDEDVEDELIGWTVVPIFEEDEESDEDDDDKQQQRKGGKKKEKLFASIPGETWRLKRGRLVLPVYCAPVPMIHQLPPPTRLTETNEHWKIFRRLGAHSTVVIWLCRGAFTNLDDSDNSDDEADEDPEVRSIDKKLWVDGGPQVRPIDPFSSEDGFDLYVDSARCLPDFVTITKVSIRIGQANHSRAAGDEYCFCQLDSDIFNPLYDFRQEYRNIPREVVPRSTIIFKIYTIDRFSQRLGVVGYSYLNLFNILGVIGQPVVDEGVQVSLNEGAFQLRIYANPPSKTTPLSIQLPTTEKHRPWPCATLLVRIVKAPKDDFGHVMSTKNVPPSKWKETGLVRDRPTNYTDGVYVSKNCRPTVGERQTFATFRRRLPFRVRKAVIEIGQKLADRTISMDNDDLLKSVLERLLSRFGLDSGPVPHGDLNSAAAYDPVYGFAVSVDSAINLPWAGAAFGHMVVNPPGAYYLGPPHTRFDCPKFLSRLDLSSPPSAPKWHDGFFAFRSRSGQRMQSTGMRMATCVVIHLQELTLRRTFLNLEYGLSNEAWTVVPIFASTSSFAHPYVANEKLLLPLFSGSPSTALLKEMSSELKLAEWLDSAIHVKKIHPIIGARLNVRVCDARRIEECTISDNILLKNHSLAALPSIREAEPPSLVPVLPPALTSVPMQTYLSTLVANDQKLLEKIISSMPDKYRQMVFKLYYSSGNK